ncbi:hypothetical protein C4D60_Mb07t23250 [Musa balbisiana]|uniref:40S ribosomal protein S11 N-terminal domain-containing protein n=1 Tax=Musa balbisiana TaxID=52838 RepID=A0A4S8JI58_MUSBA|nr:hypothetical protein C4D60_Mb07t23250 [Musa balbisiana]
MNRTIIVRRNYLHYVKEIPKASKDHGMRRGTQIFLHTSPCFPIKEGDHVIIGQCRTLGFVRPLAKTVRFNVLKVISAGSTSGGGQKAFSAAGKDFVF